MFSLYIPPHIHAAPLPMYLLYLLMLMMQDAVKAAGANPSALYRDDGRAHEQQPGQGGVSVFVSVFV